MRGHFAQRSFPLYFFGKPFEKPPMPEYKITTQMMSCLSSIDLSHETIVYCPDLQSSNVANSLIGFAPLTAGISGGRWGCFELDLTFSG